MDAFVGRRTLPLFRFPSILARRIACLFAAWYSSRFPRDLPSVSHAVLGLVLGGVEIRLPRGYHFRVRRGRLVLVVSAGAVFKPKLPENLSEIFFFIAADQSQLEAQAARRR